MKVRAALLGLVVVAASARAAPLTVETRALLVDPADPRLVLAGTVRGVYRSTDGGANWTRVGLNNTSVLSLATSPADPSLVLAGTDGRGVYRSADRGATWAAGPLNGQRVAALASDPASAQVVYAGTGTNLFKSTNGGTSFAASSAGIPSPDILSLAVPALAPATVYAGTDGRGAYRSTNAGAAWAARGLANRKVTALAVDPWDPLRLFAGTEGGGVFASVDGGATWVARNVGLTNLDVLSLALDPADPLTLVAGAKGFLFRSVDGGLTWTRLGTGTTEVWAVAFAASGLLAGTPGGAAAPPGAPADKRIGSGAWSTPSAWTPPGVPGPADRVIVEGSATLDQAAAVRRLTVRAGGTLTAAGPHGLTLSAGAEVAGALVVTGGTITCGGPATVFAGGRLTLGGAGQVLLRPGPGSLVVHGELQGRSAGARLARAGAAGAVDLQVTAGGRLDVDGLRVEHGDVEGLHVRAGATLARLRGARFDAPGTSDPAARFLTVESAGLLVSAPGCTFGALGVGQRNVLLVDTGSGATDGVVLVLEDRGPVESGPGAGEARDGEAGGAAVTWVWACPDTTRGRAVGFPQVAWDLVTGASYATYVPFADADAAGVDRIHVFDPDGLGLERAYWFEVPDARGDLAGLPWWDTSPAGAHLLWATTTTGWVYLWADPGSGTGPVAPVAGWPQQLVSSFSTGPVADRTNVYGAGRYLLLPFVGGVDRATLTLTWAAFTSHGIGGGLATEVDGGVNYVFAGSRRGGDGRARIYRVNTQTQVVDRTNTDATADLLGTPFVIYQKGLFVGDMAGRVHGLDQMTFTPRPGFPVTASPSPIEAGVFLDFVSDDRVYAGDTAGRLVAIEPTGGLVGGWPVQPLGAAAIRGMPLVDAGVLWAGNAEGRFAAVDVATRATLAEWRFGAGARLSDVAQEFTSGRTMVTSSRGGFYVVAVLP